MIDLDTLSKRQLMTLVLTQQFNEQVAMICTTGDSRAYAEQRSLVTSLERLYEDAAWSTRVGDAIRST